MTTPATWQLEILQTRPAGRDYCWIHLAAPPHWRSLPGQFVNVRCDGNALPAANRTLTYADDGPRPQLRGREAREVSPLVRRPVSISYTGRRADGRTEIVLLVRVVGAGSRYLSLRRAGETLDLVGPLGNGFDPAVAGRRAFLVGGGCGIAPLVGLAGDLAAAGTKVTVFYGAARADDVPLTLPDQPGAAPGELTLIESAAEFPEAGLVVATEDGSLGARGLVTDALTAHAARTGWEDVSLFVCGPDAMMAAVAALARSSGVDHCQVSLENYMGCGIGVCLSCAVKVRADNEQGWTYRRVCVDGPVFEADDVIFDNTWEGCKP